jgi:cleavage and polyadenylation specificity factor subunit 1
VSAEGSQPLEERVTHLQGCRPPKTTSQLRRFLGILNFYRRFLPHAVATQVPLHDALSGPRIKGFHPITWAPEILKAFEDYKASMSLANLLANPDPFAPLALVTDASTSAMGAVLQQRVKNVWQPLAFFQIKLNAAQQKYSAYDRELLSFYEAVKHFRHMLEPRHFIVFIIYSFQQNRDKCLPRQFNHLDFISQFTTDTRHISGQDNVVIDALYRVESIAAPPAYEILAAAQKSDDELQTLLETTNALRLEKIQIPGPPCLSTAIHLPGELGRTFQLHYDSKCSSPSTICLILAQKQKRRWSQNVLCGQGCKRSAATGHSLASPASAPKSPDTRLLHWGNSRCRQPVSCTST